MSHRGIGKMIEQRYLYRNTWSDAFVAECKKSHEAIEEPHIINIEKGVLLPALADRKKPWGIGGVLDQNGGFVDESRLDDSFGGFYAINEEPVFLDEEVIYLGIMPKHWGHFIIDVLSKLWCVYDYPQLRIAYCGLSWDNGVTGNYSELLQLAGIEKERLLFIDKAYKVRNVIIPSRTLGFRENYHNLYKRAIDTIISNVLSLAEQKKIVRKEKIYFTRTKLSQAKLTEVGEKRIEKVFRDNGYTVISPEKLTVVEQIFYYHTAQNIACVSGTIPHNIVFAKDGCNIAIFNRTCVINPPQIRINQLKKANCVYIDAFNRWTITHPRTYGGIDHSPVWLEINENVEHYFKDIGFEILDSKFKRMAQKCIIDNLWFAVLLLRHNIKVLLVKTNLYKIIKR